MQTCRIMSQVPQARVIRQLGGGAVAGIVLDTSKVVPARGMRAEQVLRLLRTIPGVAIAEMDAIYKLDGVAGAYGRVRGGMIEAMLRMQSNGVRAWQACTSTMQGDVDVYASRNLSRACTRQRMCDLLAAPAGLQSPWQPMSRSRQEYCASRWGPRRPHEQCPHSLTCHGMQYPGWLEH